LLKKAAVYYFTGTGNTRALAQAIAKDLSKDYEAELISIPEAPLPGSADLTVICFPVYCFGAPRLVNRYLELLPKGGGQSALVFANAADNPGDAPHMVAEILRNRGYKVPLAEWIRLPSNYILFGEAESNEEAAKALTAELVRASTMVQNHLANASLTQYSPRRPLYRLLYWAFNFGLNYIHRFYRTNEKCTRCGVCAAMCPVGSIRLLETGLPTWGKGCEHCVRCLNHCPEGAIEVGKSTVGKKRYTYFQGQI